MDALYPSNLQRPEEPVAAEVSLSTHESHTRFKLLPNVTAAVTFGSTEPNLSNHPVDMGQRTEGAILSELVRRGYKVLVPFGVNQRYDLVIDAGDRFLRVQCKTGRLRNG